MEAPRTITNRATVQASEPDSDAFDDTSEERTTVDPAADHSFSISDSPDPVRARDRLTYELVVTKNGPSTAGILSMVDSLPRDVRLVSATITTGRGRSRTPPR